MSHILPDRNIIVDNNTADSDSSPRTQYHWHSRILYWVQSFICCCFPSSLYVHNNVSSPTLTLLVEPVCAFDHPDDICAICIDDDDPVRDKDALPSQIPYKTLVRLRKCGHIFHTSCINLWIYKHKRLNPDCPVCRCKL